jgi:4-amino-4-deoxy-L-arabinose transferase-like glycosyltransferase
MSQSRRSVRFTGGSGCMDTDLKRRFQRERELPHNHGEPLALGRLQQTALPAPKPLMRPAPRSAMVFPLVVLVAVLPGMAALNSWDLTPPGPMWGLRGLAVLRGFVLDQTPAVASIKPTPEAAAFRAIAYQPPLYAWMEAIAFGLSSNRNPIGSILPSYLAGVVTVMLVYLHGRLWRGAGLGLSAAILVGFNQSLLSRIQEATPATLVLCSVLAALLAYGWYERVTVESGQHWRWKSPVLWAIIGGLSLGVALLSMSGLALIIIPIIAFHQYYLRSIFKSSSRHSGTWTWWLTLRVSPGLIDAVLALAVALIVSLPWFIFMVESHGWQVAVALAFPPYESSPGRQLALLPRLIQLTPVTLPLGLFGAVRAVRSALVDEFNTLETIGGSLWVIWLALASLTFTIWPSGPHAAFDLMLVVPLNLLAAQTIADLVNRRVSVRTLNVLAPTSAISIALWASNDLGPAISNLIHRRVDAATALGLHLALDVILISVIGVRELNHWAHRRDDRQRWMLVAFLLIILVVTVTTGLREVLFRHSETHDLLTLRTMILRRDRDLPFQILAVVSSTWTPSNHDKTESEIDQPLPGGRLRFILQTALPRLPQRDLIGIDELFDLPEGQRLIILAGKEQHLSSADQFRLGMEAIHPGRSGILDAYATAHDRRPRH